MDVRQIVSTRWGCLQWVPTGHAPPDPIDAAEFIAGMGYEPPAEKPVVSVLGALEVNGERVDGRHCWKYAKAGELLVFLALKGVTTREGVMEALWPEVPADRRRLDRVVSDARRNVASELWLPTSVHGVLELGCVTDLDRFRVLAAGGEGSEALEYVRGPLELPLGGFDWARGLWVELAAEVAGVALVVAEEGLAAENWRHGLWAARKGLDADPWNQRLLEVAGVAARGACDPGAMVWVEQRLGELA